MRKKHLPFILTAAMCVSLGVTAIGSESSEIAAEPSTGSVLTDDVPADGSTTTDTPAPQPDTPATEPDTPAPQPDTPATEPDTPAPQPDTPAPEPDTPAPQPDTPATEPDTPAPQPDTPAPEPETPAPQTETPAPTEKETQAPTEAQTQAPVEKETQKPSKQQAETEKTLVPDAFTEEEIDLTVTDDLAEKLEEEKEEAPVVSEKIEIETETELAEGMSTGLVSDGGLGELYIAVHGYPVGDLTQNEKDVYTFLRKELGLNKAAASGVLANVYFESNFSSVAVGDGGTSLGLCQWHLGRCKSLISWCGGHDVDYRSIEGQLGYLDYELNNIYKDVLGYLLGVPDTAEGAYRAGYYFCMYFESPSDTKTRSEARGTMAKNSYYPSDLDKFLQTEEKQEKEGVKLTDRARLVVKIDGED